MASLPTSVEIYSNAVSKHEALQSKLKVASTRLREYTLAQQRAKAAEVALLDSLSDIYREGLVNDLQRSGKDTTTLHEELLINPRAKHFLRSFTPTPLGAGSDGCSYADFSSNLMDGLASSVTAAIREYAREIDSLSSLITAYSERKTRYDHYVSKLTALSAKAASSEDGMEAAKIKAKLARNMEKLRTATLNHDIALEQACGELTAATSKHGINGRLDPICDRLMQFMGLDAGCRLDYVVSHQTLFGKTKGTLGGGDADSESDTDSDTDDKAYEAGEDEDEWDEECNLSFEEPTREKLEMIGKHNFLRIWKPRYKSLTRYMPREKPKHYEGWLLVRQEKKLLSSRCFCVLRGNLLCVYGNENEPLFGIAPLYDLKIKNVTEWESKSPHGLIVEDGYQEDKLVFLKCDEDAGGWLKALLRASCWDDGRSRMNILGTLTKIKKLTAGEAVPSQKPTQSGNRTASRTRSSAPHLSIKSKLPPPAPKQQERRVEPAAVGAGAGVKRRPSHYANPFASQGEARSDTSPVMFGKKNRRAVEGGVGKQSEPREVISSPVLPSNNPFDSSDEEDENMPSPPSLNPFRSSAGGLDDEEIIDTSQSTDDFLMLSESGVITYKKFLAWEEVQTAVKGGEVTEDEISMLWVEVAGGKESVDQEAFTLLVGKLEQRL